MTIHLAPITIWITSILIRHNSLLLQCDSLQIHSIQTQTICSQKFISCVTHVAMYHGYLTCRLLLHLHGVNIFENFCRTFVIWGQTCPWRRGDILHHANGNRFAKMHHGRGFVKCQHVDQSCPLWRTSLLRGCCGWNVSTLQVALPKKFNWWTGSYKPKNYSANPRRTS